MSYNIRFKNSYFVFFFLLIVSVLLGCANKAQSKPKANQSNVGNTASAERLLQQSLREASVWTTNTEHPAYQFYTVASQRSVSSSSCREHGGISGIADWRGRTRMLTQGVISGHDNSYGNIVAVGYSTSVGALISTGLCKFPVN